jgi:glucokinase
MFAATVLKPLESWKKEGNLRVCVGIDIGGSGFRTRLSNALDATEFLDLAHIRAQGTAELIESFNSLQFALLDMYPDLQSVGAALAVAGPIKDGVVILTNWPGDASLRTLRVTDLPEKLFPHDKTLLLNDLEAGAYGIVAANDSKILPKYFEQMWPQVAPRGDIVSTGRTAVLAMGSGFGVALIVHPATSTQPIVLPTELGHLQIALDGQKHPNYELEKELLQHVSDYYYDGTHAPEYEDISSGRGLCLAYQYMKIKFDNERLPIERIDGGQVAELARQGDKAARQALTWHYLLFLRAAKAIATTLCCDSVVMALDNQVKNAWFVNAISDQLKDEFYHWIRPDWLNGIRVYTQTEVLNFNILGTDYMAHRLAA